VQGSRGRLVVKLEKDSNRTLLQHEYWIYSHLKDVVGVPRVKFYGQKGRYRALVMGNAGVELDSFLQQRGELLLKKQTKYIVAFFAQEMVIKSSASLLKLFTHTLSSAYNNKIGRSQGRHTR